MAVLSRVIPKLGFSSLKQSHIQTHIYITSHNLNTKLNYLPLILCNHLYEPWFLIIPEETKYIYTAQTSGSDVS